ncbi:22760_t:CDS:2, partial [Gigaspora rosea]
SLVEQYEHDEESVTEILEGLRHLAPAINDYFKLVPSMHEKNIEESEATLILYESFTLSNKEQQEFEVCDGYCFAKVLLLIRIIFKNTLTFNLALVRWYDFKHPNIPSKFYKFGITPPSSDNSQSGLLDIVEFVREKAQDLGS